MSLFFLIAAAAQPAAPTDEPAEIIECDTSPETVDCGDVPYFGPDYRPIIVTASRLPVTRSESPASVSLLDEGQIEALDLPLASDLLRLLPGTSVSASGPRGTQTQLRIRGAEANHSLLFVDGIRLNDPASGNEARFELLTSDALSRIELVRGPQSALWGSEAIGGVIAVETADPFRADVLSLTGEYGSLDTARASAQFAYNFGDVGLSGSAGYIGSDGIDSFGDDGERDGFENRSASLKAAYRPATGTEIGLSGYWTEGESEFDGTDPLTFLRADTLDSSENRIFALRGWARGEWSGWRADADISYLDSENRNLLDGDPLNDTSGDRLTLGGQLSRTFAGHSLTAAIEHEAEDFRASDVQYGGATNQERSRRLTAFIGQWHADWAPAFATDIAVRHDQFSAFDDATTFRAAALFRPAQHWTVHAAYGEGIAQPTFFDLYGFFPGSFEGNPNLAPERSRSWEAGVRWVRDGASVGVTGFTSRLRDEIVDTFDPVTFLSGVENAQGESRRDGVEVEAAYRFSDAIGLEANYTWLDADQQTVASADLVREVRRPRHTANAAVTGKGGPLNWGASVAYVGARTDVDFDQFPSPTVELGEYVLASARLAYRINDAVELYGRLENAFDADYEDVVGYNTAGRTVYAGVRVRLGD